MYGSGGGRYWGLKKPNSEENNNEKSEKIVAKFESVRSLSTFFLASPFRRRWLPNLVCCEPLLALDTLLLFLLFRFASGFRTVRYWRSVRNASEARKVRYNLDFFICTGIFRRRFLSFLCRHRYFFNNGVLKMFAEYNRNVSSILKLNQNVKLCRRESSQGKCIIW